MSVIRHRSFFQRRIFPSGQRQVFRTFGKFEKILIIAPGKVASTMKQPIEDNLFDVFVAESGFDAVQQIMDRNFDVIVCDTTMPEFPLEMFYTALERIRPRLLNSILFLVSGETSQAAADFIGRIDGLKVWRPIEIDELFQLIEIVLGRNAVPFGGASGA